VGKDWLNFDSSPTLRLERLPIIGKVLGRIARNPQPFPDLVIYGDICKGLPLGDNSVRGVYASHVLEHLALDDFGKALQNTFKILEPGGVFRLIVPDLYERARRYIQDSSNGSPDASENFMRACHLGLEQRPKTPLSITRFLFGGSCHLWMWDEPSLINELKRAGFIEIRRCEFGDSNDPMFAQVEDADRFTDRTLNLRELAIAARKPDKRKQS
jgi:hypothetical protein